jgi:hypothetical protein
LFDKNLIKKFGCHGLEVRAKGNGSTRIKTNPKLLSKTWYLSAVCKKVFIYLAFFVFQKEAG